MGRFKVTRRSQKDHKKVTKRSSHKKSLEQAYKKVTKSTRRSQKGNAKVTKRSCRIFTERSQNGHRTVTECSQNGHRTVTKRSGEYDKRGGHKEVRRMWQKGRSQRGQENVTKRRSHLYNAPLLLLLLILLIQLSALHCDDNSLTLYVFSRPYLIQGYIGLKLCQLFFLSEKYSFCFSNLVLEPAWLWLLSYVWPL